jgi:Holliday junction resolvase
VVATAERAFAAAAPLRNTSAKGLNEYVMFFDRKTTAGGLELRIVAHLHEHLGQLIAYARGVGVSALVAVSYRMNMTIEPSPEMEQLIQKDIERGGYQSIEQFEQFVERAIQLLHDGEHLFQENKAAVHEAIGDGLAQLDRGLGNKRDVSRARLQERKASWMDSRKSSS